MADLAVTTFYRGPGYVGVCGRVIYDRNAPPFTRASLPVKIKLYTRILTSIEEYLEYYRKTYVPRYQQRKRTIPIEVCEEVEQRHAGGETLRSIGRSLNLSGESIRQRIKRAKEHRERELEKLSRNLVRIAKRRAPEYVVRCGTGECW